MSSIDSIPTDAYTFTNNAHQGGIVAEERVQRRLAAILVADVVGYSRLMGADEEGTLAALTNHLKDLIEPCIAEHRGRVVKTTGDGILAEFASVVDAVRCAVAFQQGISERNVDVSEERRIEFRIGVNLGDVIVQDDDVYGDGVNVAARLEGLCDVGEVFVSAVVHDQVEGKITATFEDLGEHTVKNIDKPIRVYRVSPEAGFAKVGPVATEVDKLFDRPAVAVLPFENIGGDPEQEYFADGLTEDIITTLSLWRSFPVIARNSTFTYKGRAVKVQEVAEELGARYVLEGSVRKGGDRVRVTAQLIDAETGHHVWAEKFDRELEDIFALQDEITQRIAATVEPELEKAEHRRIISKKQTNLDAWAYYQRGMSLLHEITAASNAQAREMFERAVELDSTYSQAFYGLAYSHHRDLLLEYARSRDDSVARCLAAAERAVALDAMDSLAHSMLGYAALWAGQHDRATVEGEKAVELNPRNPVAYALLGNALDFSGRSEEAVAVVEIGRRLNPNDPRDHIYMTVLA